MKRVVIATHNVKKAGEMLTILGARFPEIQFLTLADFPGAPEPEETGSTYPENAMIKADSAAAFTGELCVADDAGLEIDAMGGQPGVHSKRFAGEGLPFPEKMAIILRELEGLPLEKRSARFRCCVAVRLGDTIREVFEATCEGQIAEQPSGGGGFGYDPIFYLPELGCTMADLTAEQKHAISHRGKVLKLVGDYIASINQPTAPSVC
ncbi:MAG: RdgB/HAM1 family non-canonical purine NTP pyrophosphatase [Armatimonadetes bacterium]|nr:RdgB/HAM1 family non-canonical purine NTP pyrophosphatase [Armatimonadota bacterium]